MCRRLSAFLSGFVLVAAVSLVADPLKASCQELQEEKKGAEKRTARKIWTNDDFPSAPATAREEAKTSEEAPPAADPFAELNRAKEERKLTQEDLKSFHRALEELRDRRSRATENVDQDMLDLALETAQTNIGKIEERLKELDERIARLEKQTKGRKRPAPKSTSQSSTQPTAPQ